MNQDMFAVGLLIFGFSLAVFMPASTRRSWEILGSKPQGGEAVILMMRFLGLLVIAVGLVILAGMVDIAP